jgi:uncharacterized protein YggE
VTVSTGGYNVWHQTTPRDQWQASQTLELRSHDQAALLGLVGTLQSKGLAVGDLSWRLSDELARKTRAEALRKAITGLRGRAEEAAGLLGLHFVEFKEVRLDQSNPPPRPMMRMMAAAAPAPHAPPPVAEADKIDVTATVQAEAVLQPN